MLKLDGITIQKEGKRIQYQYSTSSRIDKFFNDSCPLYVTYGVSIKEVPESILAIPFLSNILPISWFAGFDIVIGEIDEDFYRAISEIKQEFAKQYPSYSLGGSVKFAKLVKNNIKKGPTAMLFSGGVDAYATYIRIYEKNPELVTIHGADIEIKDTSQWNNFRQFIDDEQLLGQNKKHYIETNVRDFYTYHVELLLKDIGWWGKVQHGLSLVGSLAPLSYQNKYSKIYIASSYTKQIDIAWGSTPQIDEKITWAGMQVVHDGYELKRQDKVDLITRFANDEQTKFKLRVCYSELRSAFNCSNCEKCYRTIIGILLNGENPNDYGFHIDGNLYDQMYEVLQSGGASRGMQYFWREIMVKTKETDTFYIIENKEKELRGLQKIKSGELDALLERKIQESGAKNKVRFILRNRFSKLYALYKNLRSK